MSPDPEDPENLDQTSTNWFWGGLDDWLFFLSGPKPPVFQCPPQFEKKRLMRLLVFAVTTSGALGLITTAGFQGVQGFSKPLAAISATSKPAIVIILAAGTLASLYAFFAKLFHVPISIADIFYVFLFVSLPWIPSTALVFALGVGMQTQIVWFLVSAWFSMTLVLILLYVCLGIYRVSHCSAWRCFASVLLPIVLIIWLVIFLREGQENPPLTPDTATPTSSAGTVSAPH